MWQKQENTRAVDLVRTHHEQKYYSHSEHAGRRWSWMKYCRWIVHSLRSHWYKFSIVVPSQTFKKIWNLSDPQARPLKVCLTSVQHYWAIVDPSAVFPDEFFWCLRWWDWDSTADYKCASTDTDLRRGKDSPPLSRMSVQSFPSQLTVNQFDKCAEFALHKTFMILYS